jgi:succinate dehydrogenase/fumarate reductase flavoprotein subunit
LLVHSGRVSGVRTRDLRSGGTRRLTAPAVILATGGFQSSLPLVREHWPAATKFPEKILLGSGTNSTGSGHRLAQSAGAALLRMDHQWNYPWGLLDPRYPGMSRGLAARNLASIWVNVDGRRFVNETASPKIVVPALVAQQHATYWAIFDEQTKPLFTISGSDWVDFKTIERLIFSDPALVRTASSIPELATAIDVPPEQLNATLRRYNDLVALGDDLDFGRFGTSMKRFPGLLLPAPAPKQITTAPFYAVQFFLLTRKSMGGVAIDKSCRVMTAQGFAIPGLYAAGEVTGLAGINGKAGLEGTFLGPSIVTGRVAARAAVAATTPGVRPSPVPPASGRSVASAPVSSPSCVKCHDLAKDTRRNRPGYWHFERSHAVVLTRGDPCVRCHQELQPYVPTQHRIDRVAQIDACVFCHGAQ